MEYRGVMVGTGEELFHYGPVADGTNNVGEFLALVHALALCEQKGWVRTIYSDSRTAQAWLRNRKTHTSRCPVVKWDTEKWGEIPADFGRK